MVRKCHPRRGFTLVEMLAVILIISVLVGLLAPAVLNAYRKGDETRVIAEIKQLENAIAAFKQQYGVSYIPDRMVFPPDPSVIRPPSTDNPLYVEATATREYLYKIWPRLDKLHTNVSVNPGGISAIVNYWCGVSNNSPVMLYGDQVLVLLLGGRRDNVNITIQQYGYCTGFSSSPTDPMKLGGTRIGPFAELPSDRLFGFGGSFANMQPRFAAVPSFVDPFQQMPYMYMSSREAGNDYNRQYSNAVYGHVAPRRGAGPSTRITAFRVSPDRFANPNSHQIICAGRNNQFGSGGADWAGFKSQSGAPGQTNSAGADDISNFWSVPLGAAQ